MKSATREHITIENAVIAEGENFSDSIIISIVRNVPLSDEELEEIANALDTCYIDALLCGDI